MGGTDPGPGGTVLQAMSSESLISKLYSVYECHLGIYVISNTETVPGISQTIISMA
jgi:hypothetical protein